MSTGQERPAFIDREYVKQFFKQVLGIDEVRASNLTYDLLLRLMYDVPQVVFVCRRCTQGWGECRCTQHGQLMPNGRWMYKSWVEPWLVVVQSLVDLNIYALEPLGPRSRERVWLLANHLRQL